MAGRDSDPPFLFLFFAKNILMLSSGYSWQKITLCNLFFRYTIDVTCIYHLLIFYGRKIYRRCSRRRRDI